MDRGIKDIAAIPEDILRSVTVVLVNVEYRNAFDACVTSRLRGHCSVIDKAIATQIICACMVSGRAAQTDRDLVASQHGIECR